MFIHTRPSGSNDTTAVIRKGSIRNKQLNRHSILEHNHTVRGTASSSASRPVNSISTRGRLVSQSTPTLRHSTNKPPHSDAPTTIQRDKRSTAASVLRRWAPCHTVRQQHYLGRRARKLHPNRNTQFTSCYVMPLSFQEAAHT